MTLQDQIEAKRQELRQKRQLRSAAWQAQVAIAKAAGKFQAWGWPVLTGSAK